MLLSTEAYNTLSIMVTLEENENNKRASMEKVIQHAKSLSNEQYENFMNGLYELAQLKYISACGKIVEGNYEFKKLETTRRGKQYYFQHIRNSGYETIEKKDKKSVEEISALLIKSSTFSLIEKMIVIITSLITCVIGVCSILK